MNDFNCFVVCACIRSFIPLLVHSYISSYIDTFLSLESRAGIFEDPFEISNIDNIFK